MKRTEQKNLSKNTYYTKREENQNGLSHVGDGRVQKGKERELCISKNGRRETP